MKKSSVILAVFLSLLVLNSFSLVRAKDQKVLDVYGGVGYNEYSMEFHNEAVDKVKSEYNPEKITGGISFFGGSRIWVRKNLAVGIEVERIKAEGGKIFYKYDSLRDGYYYYKDFSAVTDGFLVTGTYELPDGGLSNNDVFFIIGAGKYESDLSYEGLEGEIDTSGDCLGFKAGAVTNYTIKNRLQLIGRIIYRKADIEAPIDNEFGNNIVDFSGVEFSGAVKFNF